MLLSSSMSNVAPRPIGCGNTVARPLRHAVQTLVPPVVGFDAEALDARRRVHHLADLLVDVHRVEQLIDLLFHRLLRLLRTLLRLCAAAAGKHRRST